LGLSGDPVPGDPVGCVSPGADADAVAAPETVSLTLAVLLGPGARIGHALGASWSCGTCTTGAEARGIHEAVTGLADHAVRRHHKGPGVLR
jgi:hypothetical protein